MRMCVPVTQTGLVERGWGRADRVAIADVAEDIRAWEEFDVGWGTLHDTGTEGSHHARVARFLIDHGVEAVVVNHMGEGMVVMLQRMGLKVFSGISGDARQAVIAVGTAV